MLNRILEPFKKSSELRLSVHQPSSLTALSIHMRSVIRLARSQGKSPVIVCIGTDRSTGDSLGPLTGTKLMSLHTFPYLYGTLDDPVHATNLTDTLSIISSSVSNPFMIAVDACLGKLDNVGFLTIGHGPLKPGAAVSKDLPLVGDIHITGVVNVGGFMEHLVLQSTRLNLVMKMADTIASGLAFGLNDPV